MEVTDFSKATSKSVRIWWLWLPACFQSGRVSKLGLVLLLHMNPTMAFYPIKKNWPRAVERPPGGAKQSVRKSEQVSKNGQISHMNISDKCRKNYYAHIYVPSNALRPSPSSHNSAPYGGRRRGQKESIYISAFSNRDVLRARLM